ncbi:MAG: hypothetical protein JW774_10275 [Candidatus Aureabacteria bacterium]|nr:hypothetical protein [Candidatus Auribacterota bacterium]
MLEKSHIGKRLLQFFTILSLLYPGLIFAEQKEVTVPVETVVDSYLTLLLESTAVQINQNGEEISTRQLAPGSIYFGEVFGQQADKPSLPNCPFSCSFITNVKVNIINNSKPFILKLLFAPVEDQKTLLELKMADTDKSALNIKTSATELTKFAKHLESLNIWTPFPEIGEFILYDSKQEVISDEFTVTFAIKNLYSNTQSAAYSGKFIWILSSPI